MIRRILIFISLLIFISPILADESGLMNNHTPMIGENFSASTGNGTSMQLENLTLSNRKNLTEFEENETLINLMNTTAERDDNLTDSLPRDNIKRNTTKAHPASKPVYKESVGSVYEPDYTEPQARTFSYSGCGSS